MQLAGPGAYASGPYLFYKKDFRTAYRIYALQAEISTVTWI